MANLECATYVLMLKHGTLLAVEYWQSLLELTAVEPAN